MKRYTVSVESVPPGAAIYVDSKEAGPLGYTPAKIKLTKGTHTLFLALDGYEELKTPIIVKKTRISYFTYTLVRADRPGTIELRPSAADPTAVGADAYVDGTPWGPLPVTKEVPAGKHMVEVKKAGFADWMLWVEVREGDRHMVVVELKRGDTSGSIEVKGGDGGAVYVDGALKGTSPTVIDKVSEGRHLVEVKKPGFATFSKWVDVRTGERSSLSADTEEVASITTGVLKIFTNADPADVKVDGTPLGKSPLEVPKVAPGEHFIAVEKDGYKLKEELITVAAGETKVIKLEMEVIKVAKGGTIAVRSAMPGAQVFLDGGPRGMAPVTLDDIPPGSHIVVVRKEGYKEWKADVEVGVGTVHELNAELLAVGTIRVIITNAEGATVSIDGDVIGTTPIREYDVEVGSHTLIIDKPGFARYVEEFVIDGGDLKNLTMVLRELPTGPTPEERIEHRKTLAPYSAHPIGPTYVAVTATLGNPYWVDTFIASGAFSKTKKIPLALDFGFSIRTRLFITEFEGSAKLVFFHSKVAAFAMDLGLGGGPGPCSTDTFFVKTNLLASFRFRDIATATMFFRVHGWTDGSAQPRIENSGSGMCKGGFAVDSSAVPPEPEFDKRHAAARWLFGGNIEINITRRLGIVLRFYGPPSLPIGNRTTGGVFNQRKRPLYNLGFSGGRIGDLKYYWDLGVTLKF